MGTTFLVYKAFRRDILEVGSALELRLQIHPESEAMAYLGKRPAPVAVYEKAFFPRVVSSDFLCALDSKAAPERTESVISRATSCCTDVSDWEEESSPCAPVAKRFCPPSQDAALPQAQLTLTTDLQESKIPDPFCTPARPKLSPISLNCPDAPHKQRRCGAVLPHSRLRKLMRPLDFSAM